jgi:hypothetical protein
MTSGEASQKPIFNNTCNEIFTFDKFIDLNENINKDNKGIYINNNKINEDKNYQGTFENESDLRAIEVFKKVLESLEHDKWYYNASIGSTFHKIDKSLDLKNTKFGNIGNLVLHFQDKNLVTTRLSDKGHAQLKLL